MLPFSNTQNPTINALNQSTNFGLEITLNGCTSEPGSIFIVADEPPIIEAQLGSGEFCQGADVVFTAVNTNTDLTGDLTYTLSGPDGLLVDVAAPANGVFEYTLTEVDMVNEGQYSLLVDNGADCVSNVKTNSGIVVEAINTSLLLNQL